MHGLANLPSTRRRSQSLPRSTVERGTLYFWEHALFHALDDFAKVRQGVPFTVAAPCLLWP
jgi:hypothetical protein